MSAKLYQVVLVHEIAGRREWETITASDPAALDIRFTPTGTNLNFRCREELQNEPTYKELCGPMWGGIDAASGKPIMRYEDWTAYEIMSR
jgi:hypothetical protein